MHVVIGGFGRVGRYLAHALEEQGHSVAVVDRNVHVFDEYGDAIRGRKLTGEVFDRDTLVKAGIERADAFAAVTSGDNSNIVSARIARERFSVPNVIARIYDPRRAVIYEQFGIPTVGSVQWATSRLLAMMLEPGLIVELAHGGGEVVTLQVDVPARLAGRRIVDLEYPGKLSIGVVVRDGVARLPESRFEVRKGDRLSVTATREALPEIDRLLELDKE